MWQLRCAVGAAKSLLPFQNQLRRLKRSVLPPAPDATYENAISGGGHHIAAFRREGLPVKGQTFLEIGSGWFPIIPMMFRMVGAERVYLTDPHRLLDRNGILGAAGFLRDRKASVAERLGIDPAQVEDVVEGLDGLELDQMMEELGFTYLAPFEIGVDSVLLVDGVFSQTVLEHIPPATIEDIVEGLKGSLPSGTVMSHGIDNTDHRSHRDNRLGRFDFLRYSETTWRMLCLNPQDYTNRLRHSEYVDLFERCGCQVRVERKYASKQEIEEVMGMQLWGRFREAPADDLAVAWSHLVCRLP
jgi:hypothetical protein